MNSYRLRRAIGGAALTLSLLFGVGLAASATAQAQWRNDRYYGNDGYRIAQDQGYRDGLDKGSEHRRKDKRYNPEGTDQFKDADNGYHREYGSKDAYKQAYRDGFRRGYDVGFNGRDASYGNDPYYRNDPYYGRDRNGDYRRSGDYGGYGNYGPDIYQIAGDQGYRDGLDKGAEHARNGKRYNPEGTDRYEDADNGYHSQYGSKDVYKQAYRDGFRRGYDEGYRRNGSGYGRRSSIRNWFPFPLPY